MSQKRSSCQSSLFARISKHIVVAVGLVLPAAMCLPISAQMQTVSIIDTVAGSGTAGFSGDGGQAVNASFNFPRGPAYDSAGNLYVSDYRNHRVRKIAPDGTITTFAGNGTAGGREMVDPRLAPN